MKKSLIPLFTLTLTLIMASCNNKPAAPEVDPNETDTLRLNCMITVKPENQEKFLALAKELVDSTKRNDAGCIDYDLYRCASDSKKYLIYETWTGETALAAHSASEHFTRLVPQLAEVEAENVVYKMRASDPADDETKIRINCPITVAKEKRYSLSKLILELVHPSQKDMGNIDYDLYLSTTDATKLLILETWPDQTSLDAHMAAEHFTRLVPQIQAECDMGIEIFHYK